MRTKFRKGKERETMMEKKADKKIKWLFRTFLVFALAVSFAAFPVFAASPGVYTAAATAHYRHPVTGVIEDSGGEGQEALGQAMTESALYKTALVEVDASGNTYITIRLQLMDNIKNPSFKVSSGGSGSFSGVSVKKMQASGNTADYRMKVPGENAIIRCSMDVIAMGRPVIFYITVSGLKSGHGDFITSIKTESSSNENSSGGSSSGSGNSSGSSSSKESSGGSSSKESSGSSASKGNSSSGGTSSKNSGASQSSDAAEAKDSAKETSAAETKEEETEQQTEENKTEENADPEEETDEESSERGIVEYDGSGKDADSNGQGEQTARRSPGTGIIAGIVIIAAAALAGWYFGFYRKNRH